MYPQPPSFLGVIKYDRGAEKNVTLFQPEDPVYTGIMWKSFAPGIVPVYEENISRIEAGIGLDAWLEMAQTEKALIIASRRVKNSIEMQQAEAEHRKSLAESKRNSK